MSRVHRISPMLHGHTRIEFEDGSSLVLVRGTLKKLPEIGEEYPPKPKMEAKRAVNAKASRKASKRRFSSIFG